MIRLYVALFISLPCLPQQQLLFLGSHKTITVKIQHNINRNVSCKKYWGVRCAFNGPSTTGKQKTGVNPPGKQRCAVANVTGSWYNKCFKNSYQTSETWNNKEWRSDFYVVGREREIFFNNCWIDLVIPWLLLHCDHVTKHQHVVTVSLLQPHRATSMIFSSFFSLPPVNHCCFHAV